MYACTVYRIRYADSVLSKGQLLNCSQFNQRHNNKTPNNDFTQWTTTLRLILCQQIAQLWMATITVTAVITTPPWIMRSSTPWKIKSLSYTTWDRENFTSVEDNNHCHTPPGMRRISQLWKITITVTHRLG